VVGSAAVAVVAHDAPEAVAIDATVAVVESIVHIRVLPGSSYLDGSKTIAIDGMDLALTVDQARDVQIMNAVAVATRVHIEPGMTFVNAEQQFRPATITPRCPVAGATVEIDGDAAIDRAKTIVFERNAMSSKRFVHVVFYDAAGHTDDHGVTVTAGEAQEVTCALH
jgi:hypothetical protein